MNIENFKKIEADKLEQISGGFWQLFALALPWMFQAVSQGVATFKMASSTNGSVKYNGYESHWGETSSTRNSTKSSKDNESTKQIVYAY